MNVLHAEVTRELAKAQAAMPAAEAHGCLCGALCAVEGYAFDQWLAEIAPEAAETEGLGAVRAPLRLLFESTVQSLRSDGMEFAPLLPDDDSALAERTEALAQWAQGFLYGLATGGIGSTSALPPIAEEILGDFAEIGRATVSPDVEDGPTQAGDEADEEAFAELHEFVRAGTQLVHDELLPLRRH